ncbi:MAG TPA: hypothetical protein PLD20_04330 [Blastocatellia bacterium]|nr:hypothetical protein [Blastocatellia bacterium]HMX28038.1 hypothetical protein [Blastocatellia bacterium]HMZ17133.1 hypothetical protein [Blastocatellia bacterium]HNG32617.1 hypothetical protein [Blastocatellia bacterium]
MTRRKVYLCAGLWLCALVNLVDVVHTKTSGAELPQQIWSAKSAAFVTSTVLTSPGNFKPNQDFETKDIILSANGAAGSQDWEYNAAFDQGWVQHTINWVPKGSVSKVQWRCVHNCEDARKFEYRVKFDNGRMVLAMRATTRERGLIRVELTALTGSPTDPVGPKNRDFETKDIILSANGAAGSRDWEYNAAYDQGWVQHTVNWTPKGRVSKVQWRCVDNFSDERKFEYRVKFDNGRMVLAMRATTKERGLIRVQLTALVE